MLHPPVGNGTRRLADNLSDLKAQVAANQTGIKLILDMVQHYSLATVQAYMHFVQHHAEHAVRDSLRQLSQQLGLANIATIHAHDQLDDPVIATDI